MIKYCLFILLAFASCNNEGRDMKAWEDSLNAKENRLQIREQELQQKEDALLALNNDSTAIADTLAMDPAIIGTWSVLMTCTETTCAGSAVGDIKNEQWTLAVEGEQLVARAMAEGKLVRIYTGKAMGKEIALSVEKEADTQSPAAKMTVRASLTNATTIEGQREINRDGACTIVYKLEMKKQKT